MENEKKREYYIKEITGLLAGVNDLKFLEFMFRFIRRTKENWGV